MTETVTVVSALTTAVTQIASDANSAIAAILPVALPIMGAFIVVGLGIKLIKRVTGR